MGSRKRAKRLTSSEVISKRYSPARSQLGVDIQLSGFRFKQTCDFFLTGVTCFEGLVSFKR